MALHFSCNQYQREFHSKRLQNWEVAKTHRRHPQSLDGFTQIVASDRGHLLDGVPRSKNSPWGAFVGTWDMPLQIPGNKQINPTARTSYAHQTLLTEKKDKDYVILGKEKSRLKSPLSGSPPKDLQDNRQANGINTQRSGAHNPSPKNIATAASPRKSVSPKMKSATPPMMTAPVDDPRTPPPATPPAVPDPTKSPLPVRPKSNTPVNSPQPGHAEHIAVTTPPPQQELTYSMAV